MKVSPLAVLIISLFASLALASSSLRIDPTNDTTPNLTVITPLQNGQNKGYYLTFRIGNQTDNQVFTMSIDVTHPWTWVPSYDCGNCYMSNLWSSSYYNISAKDDSDLPTEELDYRRGIVYAYRADERMHFQGFDSSVYVNQSLYFARNISQGFFDLGSDGQIGLGIPEDRNDSAYILNALYDAGLITTRSFSLYLTEDHSGVDVNSRLIFGGYNTSYIGDDTMGVTPVKSSIAWAVGLNSVSIAGQSLNMSSAVANVSIHFDDIGMPSEDLDTLLTYLEDLGIDCQNNYPNPLCRCDNHDFKTFPDITFELDNMKLTLGRDSYVAFLQGNDDIYLSNTPGDYKCFIRFQALNETEYNKTTGGNVTWILGKVMLNNYYTFYDYDNMNIGFALLSKGESQFQYLVSGTLLVIITGGTFFFISCCYFIVKTCNMKDQLDKKKKRNEKGSAKAKLLAAHAKLHGKTHETSRNKSSGKAPISLFGYSGDISSIRNNTASDNSIEEQIFSS